MYYSLYLPVSNFEKYTIKFKLFSSQYSQMFHFEITRNGKWNNVQFSSNISRIWQFSDYFSLIVITLFHETGIFFLKIGIIDDVPNFQIWPAISGFFFPNLILKLRKKKLDIQKQMRSWWQNDNIKQLVMLGAVKYEVLRSILCTNKQKIFSLFNSLYYTA